MGSRDRSRAIFIYFASVERAIANANLFLRYTRVPRSRYEHVFMA